MYKITPKNFTYWVPYALYLKWFAKNMQGAIQSYSKALTKVTLFWHDYLVNVCRLFILKCIGTKRFKGTGSHNNKTKIQSLFTHPIDTPVFCVPVVQVFYLYLSIRLSLSKDQRIETYTTFVQTLGCHVLNFQKYFNNKALCIVLFCDMLCSVAMHMLWCVAVLCVMLWCEHEILLLQLNKKDLREKYSTMVQQHHMHSKEINT